MRLTYASSCNVAWIESPSILANAISFLTIWFTESVLATRNIFAWCFALYSWWCSYISIFTFTMKTTNSICTNRKRTTWLCWTFIYVYAICSLWNKAFLTEALIFDTFCVISAIEIGFA